MKKNNVLTLLLASAIAFSGLCLTSCGPKKDPSKLVDAFKNIDSECEKITETCIKKLNQGPELKPSLLAKDASTVDEPDFTLSEVNYFTGLMYSLYVFYNIDYAVENGYPTYGGSYTDIVYDQLQTVIHPNSEEQLKKNGLYCPFYCTFADEDFGYSVFVDWDCTPKGATYGYFVSVFGQVYVDEETGRVSKFYLTTTTTDRPNSNISALDFSFLDFENESLFYTRLQSSDKTNASVEIIDSYNKGNLSLQKAFDLGFEKAVLAKGNITTDVKKLIMGGYEIAESNVNALINNQVEFQKVSDAFDEIYSKTKIVALRDLRNSIVTPFAKRVYFYEPAVTYGKNKANVYLEYDDNEDLVKVHRTGYFSKDKLMKAIKDEANKTSDNVAKSLLNELYNLYNNQTSLKKELSNDRIIATWEGYPTYQWHTTSTMHNPFDFKVQDRSYENGTRYLEFTLDDETLSDVEIITNERHAFNGTDNHEEYTVHGNILEQWGGAYHSEEQPEFNRYMHTRCQPETIAYYSRCVYCNEILMQSQFIFQYDKDNSLIYSENHQYQEWNESITTSTLTYSKDIIDGVKVCTSRTNQHVPWGYTDSRKYDYSNVSINGNEYSFHFVETYTYHQDEDINNGKTEINYSIITADIDVVIKNPKFIDFDNFTECCYDSFEYISVSGLIRMKGRANSDAFVECKGSVVYDKNEELEKQYSYSVEDYKGNVQNITGYSVRMRLPLINYDGTNIGNEYYYLSDFEFACVRNSFFVQHNIWDLYEYYYVEDQPETKEYL